MRIHLASITVDDQQKALDFYTGVLGFTAKHDLPVGAHRWLTVVSPEDLDGAELLLEPDANPSARRYQGELFEQGIPAASFAVGDVRAEFERLRARGVRFASEPTDVGGAVVAALDDTCGNWVQLVQEESG